MPSPESRREPDPGPAIPEHERIKAALHTEFSPADPGDLTWEPEPPGLARTGDEARLYMDLRPCQSCGSAEVPWQAALVSAGGELARSYSGSCAGCGRYREFTFLLPELPMPRPAGALVCFGGEEPSELLDPGEWLWVADLAASNVPAGDPAAARHALAIAWRRWRRS